MGQPFLALLLVGWRNNKRTYENDEGEKKYVFEIISNDILLLNN